MYNRIIVKCSCVKFVQSIINQELTNLARIIPPYTKSWGNCRRYLRGNERRADFYNKFSLLQAETCPWLALVRSSLTFRARNVDRLKLIALSRAVSPSTIRVFSRCFLPPSYLRGYRIVAALCENVVARELAIRPVALYGTESRELYILFTWLCPVIVHSCFSTASAPAAFRATIAPQFSSRGIAFAFIQLPLEIA